MLYTNLFKVNKSVESKSKVFYMVESRKYKFELIFDKPLKSLLASLSLGTFMIGSVNLGVFLAATSSNNSKIKELEIENTNYLTSLSQVESLKKAYSDQKENADSIFNISDKPTKWSSIIDSIADQLPYDSLLTSVSTVNASAIHKDSEGIGGLSPEDTNTDGTNGNTDVNGGTTKPGTPGSGTNPNTNGNANVNPNVSGGQAEGESDVINDTIKITGKSLSMVNLSLFLDKLDKLDIFSKVECIKAEKEIADEYYEFVIYAYLN